MSGQIEFLDAAGPEPGPAECLDQPPPGHRRWRAALVVAAGLLVGGAVVARIVTAGSSAPTAARTTTPAHVSVTRPAAPPTAAPTEQVNPGGLPRVELVDGKLYPGAGPCPEADDGLSACTVVDELPVSVVAAVRSAFPQAENLAANTQVSRETHRLWSRYLTFDVGSSELQVFVVQPGVPSIRPAMHETPNGLYQLAASRTPAAVTVVECLTNQDPLSHGADPVTVQAFVRDPRLTRL